MMTLIFMANLLLICVQPIQAGIGMTLYPALRRVHACMCIAVPNYKLVGATLSNFGRVSSNKTAFTGPASGFGSILVSILKRP
jgi:hypothetical protein